MGLGAFATLEGFRGVSPLGGVSGPLGVRDGGQLTHKGLGETVLRDSRPLCWGVRGVQQSTFWGIWGFSTPRGLGVARPPTHMHPHFGVCGPWAFGRSCLPLPRGLGVRGAQQSTFGGGTGFRLQVSGNGVSGPCLRPMQNNKPKTNSKFGSKSFPLTGSMGQNLP